MPFKIVTKKDGWRITRTGKDKAALALDDEDFAELVDALKDYFACEYPPRYGVEGVRIAIPRMSAVRMEAIETALTTLTAEIGKASLNQGNGLYQVLQELRIQRVAGAQDVDPFNFAQLETKIDFLIRTLNGTAAPREEGKDPFQSE